VGGGGGGLLAAGPKRSIAVRGSARARFVHNIIHTVPVSKTEERDRGLNCVPSNFLRR
jgi:hypothetical protein